MKTLTQLPVLKDISVDWIKDFSKTRNEPSWLLPLRLKAFEQYNALPWPTLRDEKWKRAELNLLSFEKIQFSPTKETPLEKDWLSLEEAVKKNPEPIQKAWSLAIERAKDNKFFLLTLALGNGGSCLFVGKNQNPAPYHYATSKGERGTAQFPLNFISVDESSHVQIWENLKEADKTDQNGDISFIGSFTSFHLEANANASIYSVQQWDGQTVHFQFQDITQERDSRINAIAVQLGGRVFRNETTIRLQGQGAENKVLGVLFGDEKQNFENWIVQNHTAKKTISDIQYRGALKGTSQSFFSGMVLITKEAQQSDAFQSNKSLLLSKDARADAIPNLEILADDVKCAHGAAVGSVDEDQKYYLQTRGIPPEKAEEMIIQGFFEPVIDELPSEEAQDKLRVFVEEKLRRR